MASDTRDHTLVGVQLSRAAAYMALATAKSNLDLTSSFVCVRVRRSNQLTKLQGSSARDTIRCNRTTGADGCASISA